MRLHDDVELGPILVAGTRVMKLAPGVESLFVERSVTVTSPTTAALADRLLDLDLADPVLGDVAVDPVTVVIPVRDNPGGVDRLLHLLGSHLPCIVVDDASADAAEVGRTVARHGAMLVRLDHNVGPAAARDAGLRRVETPVVAFIDSDVEVTAAALAMLRRHFADPRLAAVAPRVRTRTGSRWFERYEASCGSLDLGPRPTTVRPWSPVTYVPSACLVARVDALGNGFEPSLRSGEDVDLIWRLQSEGHRVRYAAEVNAQHDSRSTLGGWLGRKMFYGTSAAPLEQRHGDRVAPAVMTRPVAVAAAGVLVQRRWSQAIAVLATGVFVRDTTASLVGLPRTQQASVVTATGRAMVGQTSALMLRHWWPVSLVMAVLSRRYRRALAVAAIADGLLAHRASDAQLDPARFTLARRVADIAYGLGVWQGAGRQGSWRCLAPRWVSSSRGRS